MKQKLCSVKLFRKFKGNRVKTPEF